MWAGVDGNGAPPMDIGRAFAFAFADPRWATTLLFVIIAVIPVIG